MQKTTAETELTTSSQARQLFRAIGIGPGNSLLGGIAVCFMLLPYVIHRYGERIREMSKNARHDVRAEENVCPLDILIPRVSNEEYSQIEC